MVSVNYYSLPWWLGSVHYGEQDTINIIYADSDAEHGIIMSIIQLGL